MSKRENIVADIVDTLVTTTKDDTTRLTIKKVTREPVIVEDLAATAMPCLYVQSATESREYGTMGGEIDGELEILMHLYVNSNTRDSDRNLLLEILENAIMVDTTRNSNAVDTKLTNVELVETGEYGPYASLAVTIVVDYNYIRGAE